MGSGHFRSGSVLVGVGDPISTKDLDAADRMELTQRLYREVSEMMQQDQVNAF